MTGINPETIDYPRTPEERATYTRWSMQRNSLLIDERDVKRIQEARAKRARRAQRDAR